MPRECVVPKEMSLSYSSYSILVFREMTKTKGKDFQFLGVAACDKANSWPTPVSKPCSLLWHWLLAEKGLKWWSISG